MKKAKKYTTDGRVVLCEFNLMKFLVLVGMIIFLLCTYFGVKTVTEAINTDKVEFASEQTIEEDESLWTIEVGNDSQIIDDELSEEIIDEEQNEQATELETEYIETDQEKNTPEETNTDVIESEDVINTDENLAGNAADIDKDIYSDVELTSNEDEEKIEAIYLNGSTGKDEDAGTSIGTEVATFEKAKELALNNNVDTIRVTGTITVSGIENWDGENLNLVRDESFTNDDLIKVTGSLTLQNIVIDGKDIKIADKEVNLINVDEGNLNIGEGTIIQNHDNEYKKTSDYNAAIYIKNGYLQMNGGIIQNCSGALFGGAIEVIDSEFVLNDGIIQNNSGINGGGVYLWGTDESEIITTFTMNGGTIDNNKASNYGGGIYVGLASRAIIEAGYITNNEQTSLGAWGGGGIYVNGEAGGVSAEARPAGELYLYNAEITDNETTTSDEESKTKYDSVISCCQIGILAVNLTEGAVIHDNGAVNTIVVYRTDSTSGIGISPIMLGGAPYNWTDKDGNTLELDNDVFNNGTEGYIYALTKVSTKDNNVSGLDRVKTFISGNKAVVLGAAIGTNGFVQIGKEDGDVTLNIEKYWDERAEKLDEIKLYICATDGDGNTSTVGHVTLSDENNWKTTITNLPKWDSYGNEYTYTIVEEEDYYADIQMEKQEDDDNNDNTEIYNITVTNKVATQLTIEKDWEDDENSGNTRPDSIIVDLYQNGEYIDSIELVADENGEWLYTFDKLDKYDEEGNEYIYTVEEEMVENYMAEYDTIYDEDIPTGYVITNTYIAEEDKIDGEEPKDQTPGENKNNEEQNNEKGLNPLTGDIIMIAVAILVIAILGLIITVKIRKKLRNK